MDFLLKNHIVRTPVNLKKSTAYIVDDNLLYIALLYPDSKYYLHAIDNDSITECLMSSYYLLDFDEHIIKINRPIKRQTCVYEEFDGDLVRALYIKTVSGNPSTFKAKQSTNRNIIVHNISKNKKLF